jgi:hypothetical protein
MNNGVLIFFWEDSNTLAFEIGVVSVILPVLEVLLQDKTRQDRSSPVSSTNERTKRTPFFRALVHSTTYVKVHCFPACS